MTDYAIAICCFLDDILQKSRATTHQRRKLNDAQVITTALMAARFFYGNFARATQDRQHPHGFSRLYKAELTRHVHPLEKQFKAIFFGMGQALKQLNTSRYLIESLPGAVCKNIRIPCCRILPGEGLSGQ